ncbi:hypothetical protein [Actinomadura bangladeshensis]|uniref:Uncharacterized protein n=1 Tax=Actinomadura bangladeshensis TaxID=453573 RepID=A0A6L9QAE0_9ACTN|nr:hypothetical protein [Actinomadura bangladeshensis]NEA22165.1 hypothetical protein [Actinomadura bangladeshensis]
MTGLAVAMDVVAAGFLALFVVLLTRGRSGARADESARANEGGRSVALVLIAVSLGLLSVSLWSLP